MQQWTLPLSVPHLFDWQTSSWKSRTIKQTWNEEKHKNSTVWYVQAWLQVLQCTVKGKRRTNNSMCKKWEDVHKLRNTSVVGPDSSDNGEEKRLETTFFLFESLQMKKPSLWKLGEERGVSVDRRTDRGYSKNQTVPNLYTISYRHTHTHRVRVQLTDRRTDQGTRHRS